jgi:cobalamin biosynthesis Co2+ chelatase CbiK
MEDLRSQKNNEISVFCNVRKAKFTEITLFSSIFKELMLKTYMTTVALGNVGLVLIGHGSRLPYNKENFEKIAEVLRNQSKFKIVEIAFMIRNKPTISEAIDVLAKKGMSKIVLVPASLRPVCTLHRKFLS